MLKIAAELREAPALAEELRTFAGTSATRGAARTPRAWVLTTI